ncbi:MAG: response regulator [Nitrososphaeraceae archaeon]|nr:response regulator [Nitrososphaeraceae archaeon]
MVTKTRKEENGIRSSSNTEIIQNPRESIKLAYDLIKSAEQEVLRIFPSIHAFRRQVRMGIMHLFKEVVENDIIVRVLIHADEKQIRETVNEVKLVFPEIELRAIEMNLDTSIGIVVVDRKESLIIETKDDTKDNSYDASGLAAYSNSKHIATSYASIFESLWIQAELYEQLKEANKQLKVYGKLQKFSKSIAIVGDDTYLVNLLSQTLKMNGYDVCSFTDPLLAYEYIKENLSKYSLLITDYGMSLMNGLFLATKLLEINPQMNVILLSAFDLDCNYKFNILKKPISIYKLIKVVNESISTSILNDNKL